MARYQDTFTHLEAAWRRFESARSTLARDQADRVVAELAVMHAQLGHREALRPLFASLRTRPPWGVAAERLNHAWEGLQTMELDPGRAYLCGPLALRAVWQTSHDSRVDPDPRIAAIRSTHQGTNVSQLAESASAAGMNLRAVRHPVGTPWTSPMVIHWKVGHFAAIIDQHDLGQGHTVYLLRDPTFGEDRWTTGSILDHEASGVVLASASDAVTANWPAVTEDVARSTWGRGATAAGKSNDWGKEHWMQECGGKSDSKGMPRRRLVTHLATLAVEDTPVWNNPAVGDPLEFSLFYNQADWQGTAPDMGHLGQRWMHNWRSEVVVTTATSYWFSPPTNVSPNIHTTHHRAVTLYSRTGGADYYHTTVVNPTDPLPELLDFRNGVRLVLNYNTAGFIETIHRNFPDGSQETYAGSGDNAFGAYPLTEIRDPQGRVTTLVYGSHGPYYRRLESVVAPSGTMVFHYDSDDPEAENFLLIRSVSIGDRLATLAYANVLVPTGDGGTAEGPLMLTGITDMGGITSTFEYGSADRGLDPHENPNATATSPSIPDLTFLRYMTTPYGRTEFRTGWGLDGMDYNPTPARQIHRRRWLDVIYPGGERERLARQDIDQYDFCPSNPALCFAHTIPIPPSYTAAMSAIAGVYPITQAEATNTRNSFYWDTTAFARARARNPSGTGEPEQWDLSIRDAHTYHWLHAAYDTNRAGSTLESEEEAGELRVFYHYQGQSRPSYIDHSAHPVTAITPSTLLIGVYRHVSDTGTNDQQDRSSTFTYNTDGRLASATDDEGQRIVYAYTTDGDLERVTRDVGSGTQELIADLTYDSGHPHLPVTMRDGSNQVTALAYNTNHQLTTITRPDASTIVNTYDGTTHRLTSVTSPAGTASTTYNTRGLPATVTTIEGITRSFTYDDLDRVLTVTAPGSRTVTYDYRYRDENGALALDTNGDPFQALEATSVTGVDGNATVRSYDALHRLRYSTTSGGSDPTRYRYDVAASGWFHRLELLRVSGGSTVPTTQWSFPLDTSYSTRPTRLRRGVSGAYEDTAYAYNNAGELTTMTAPDAAVTTFEYDEVGRTKRVCRDSMCADGAEYTYDLLRGRLTHSATLHGGVSVDRGFTYGAATVVGTPMPTTTLPDAERVVEAREYTYTGSTLTDSDTAGFAHDVLGRRATVTHDGETLTYQYDTAGRFTGLVNNATTPPTEVLVQQYGSSVPRRPALAYLPRTNCVRDFLYQSASDDHQMYSSWAFNSNTWQRLAATDLTFTADGRLNSEEDELTRRYFYYNLARRLEFYSEYVNNGAGTYNLESGNDAYYNAWGDLTSINRYQDWGSGWGWNVVEGRTFSLSDRMLTRAMGPSASPTHSLMHDARGRVTADGEYTYGWDVRDRLTTVTRTSDSQSWTFVYDASGRLTSMVEGAETVRLRWRGSRLRGERIEASGSSPIDRVYRADGIDQGGTHLALVRDVRGSVVGLATDGDRVRTYRYGVWGEQTVVAPATTPLGAYDTHMGFTGHVVHRPTGLVFAPARVYSSRLRQWLTRDPAGERDSIDGRNLYAYVAGDPVNFVDPTGRTRLWFDISSGFLTVDPEQPGRSPYRIGASSGSDRVGTPEHPGLYCIGQTSLECLRAPFIGPLPPGNWYVRGSEISNPDFVRDYLRQAFTGDWGDWRVRIHRRRGTNGFGRSGFFLHGGSRVGSGGCIDVGGGDQGNPATDRLREDIAADPDDFVPLEVR